MMQALLASHCLHIRSLGGCINANNVFIIWACAGAFLASRPTWKQCIWKLQDRPLQEVAENLPPLRICNAREIGEFKKVDTRSPSDTCSF